MPHLDDSKWISELAGRPLVPPRRETLEDLIESREFWRSIADVADLPAGVEVHEDVLLWDRGETKLTAEVYVPEGDGPFPLFLHFHGGGYCTGGVFNDRKLAMTFAKRGYVVVSPEYALAPEHPFPRAVEDCLYATRWAVAHAAEYQADATRLVLEGGSAGGGLVASTLLALGGLAGELEQGDLAEVEAPVAAAVLWYGMFSFPLLLSEPGSNVGAAELWSRAYLGPRFTEQLRHPLVSAAFAPGFAGWPPVYLACGIEDSMLGHTLELTRALAAADVPATLSVVEGLDHNFVKLAGSNPAAAAELARMHAWLDARVPGAS